MARKLQGSEILTVETFKFVRHLWDTFPLKLIMKNGSELEVDWTSGEGGVILTYNNFQPARVCVQRKYPTSPRDLGTLEIIPPQTCAYFTTPSPSFLPYCCILKVYYKMPDADNHAKDNAGESKTGHNLSNKDKPGTFATDYDDNAEALKDLSDISLICKGKTFSCHKVVLAARSEILAGLFKKTSNDKINLKDFAPSTVDKMITFIYTDQLPKDISKEDSEELFKIADKYRVHALKQTCELMLLKDLDVGNSLKRLHFAKKYKAVKLMEKSLKIVKDNIAKLMTTKDFTMLVADFPDILQEQPITERQVVKRRRRI